MGLNAYFAFQVVGVNGSGSIPYRTALTAIFIEGFIFILLALTGMRQWLVKIIPATLKTATGVGIGFLLTEVGLSYSSGIGAITGGGRASPLTLGGCPAELIDPVSGVCTSGQMTNPKVSACNICSTEARLTCEALARRSLRWHLDCFFDGIQDQICARHWYRFGLCHFLAVSFSTYCPCTPFSN